MTLNDYFREAFLIWNRHDPVKNLLPDIFIIMDDNGKTIANIKGYEIEEDFKRSPLWKYRNCKAEWDGRGGLQDMDELNLEDFTDFGGFTFDKPTEAFINKSGELVIKLNNVTSKDSGINHGNGELHIPNFEIIDGSELLIEPDDDNENVLYEIYIPEDGE